MIVAGQILWLSLLGYHKYQKQNHSPHTQFQGYQSLEIGNHSALEVKMTIGSPSHSTQKMTPINSESNETKRLNAMKIQPYST
jgi:hypothetical protein